jgi:hypothetical protein
LSTWMRRGRARQDRLVLSMSTHKIHRPTCRYVSNPGSGGFPYADEAAVKHFPACRVCETDQPG